MSPKCVVARHSRFAPSSLNRTHSRTVARYSQWYGVQAKIDSKLRREREAQEAIDSERRKAEAIIAEEERIQAEIDARIAREARSKEEADALVQKMKQAKMDDIGTVSWPLRTKPIYLSYAKDAAWDER
eukprot:2630293-Pyramimonas_sp.AAC.1